MDERAQRLDRILGTLYGQAIGDAMGMPSELWPVGRIRHEFGKITDFLPGPSSNEVAVNYGRGQYTDDTQQALVILDALIETDWQPDQRVLGAYLVAWADAVDAWSRNILGPSSKAALNAIKAGIDASTITNRALTNGAAMRIAPIGALFQPYQLKTLIKTVTAVTKVTHSSDVAYSGAAMVAGAVTAAIAGYSWDDIIHFALACNDRGFQLGAPTWAAKTRSRLTLAIGLADQYVGDTKGFSRAIYELVGTGTMISESVPAAVAIAYYCRNVHEAALMAANLGGDTDTIGAMATAICGAKNGVKSISPAWCRLIDDSNPQYQLHVYAERMLKYQIQMK